MSLIDVSAASNFPPALAGLLAEAEGALSHDLAACRAALAAAADLLALSDEGEDPAGALASWQKTRLIEVVEQRLEHPVSLDDLAEAVGLSSSYLCRAFRASFGQSPHAYVISRRLERARTLMIGTEEPLSQIAGACGFADQAHLCRLFSRAFGAPPHRWRLAQRETIAQAA